MNWFTLRQHRKQFIIAGVFLILFAAYMIPTGMHFWSTYQHVLATCSKTDTCNQATNELLQSGTDMLMIRLTAAAIAFMPIFLGLFWGVPLLAREYADGTNKLVWTQSISRKKWLSTKLFWVLLVAAVTAGAFVALDTWWFKTFNALQQSRFIGLYFNTQGFVAVGYAIFAVSLGACLGALFKRTMLALGITLITLIAVILIIVPSFVRPKYMSPSSVSQSVISDDSASNGLGTASVLGSSVPGSAWVINSYTASSSGQALNWSNPPSKCVRTAPLGFTGGHGGIRKHAVASGQGDALASQNGGPVVSMDCLHSIGYVTVVKYQPSSRYWDFQRIETGIYLALSILPIGAIYWLVIKRDA